MSDSASQMLRAAVCIAESAERMRWFAQITKRKPASRNAAVGVV